MTNSQPPPGFTDECFVCKKAITQKRYWQTYGKFFCSEKCCEKYCRKVEDES